MRIHALILAIDRANLRAYFRRREHKTVATVLISAEGVSSAIQRGARRYIAPSTRLAVRPLPWHGETNDFEVMAYPGQVMVWLAHGE